jgi:5-methylcytosine-specific restriction endonuclease McrA
MAQLTGICDVCGNEFIKRQHKHTSCKTCRDKEKLHKGETTEYARFIIFERDDFKCVYCGRSSIEDGISLCLDHVRPYSISHDNSIYNLVSACYECNMMKSGNPLRRDIYKRIIQRNIKRNGGISVEKQIEVDQILDSWFTETKDGNRFTPTMKYTFMGEIKEDSSGTL